jgi:Ca2+-binding RTX toxin-like protein
LIYRVGTAFQALNQGQTATDSFSYTMQDSAGVRSTASVTVTVVGANEAPPPGSIIGTAFDDIINATNADDTIFGLTGDDQISSAGGADTLFGGPGKDTLDGGAGNDVLVGDNDRDELTGGPGADIFRFNFVSDSIVSNPDKIRDFSSAEGDRIDLRLIDANTTSAGDNAFSLSAGLTGVAGQLVFDQTASLVQGDVNGDALADFAISVRLAGAGGLSAGDFLL